RPDGPGGWSASCGSCRCLRSCGDPLGGVLAAGAEPPEGDFGLVHGEAVGVRRLEARGLADGAIDVDRDAAGAADEVVVVVADARLVPDRAPGGRDPPGEPGAMERLADVVGGLGGDAHARGADALDQLVDA